MTVTAQTDWRYTMMRAIGYYIETQIKPLNDEIAKLKAQVAALEEGGIKYCGTYQRANEYRRGEMVTFDGSVWCAIADVKPLELPGKVAAWVLAVRAGRDEPRSPTKGGARTETQVWKRT